MWKHRTCSGCQQACNYATVRLEGTIGWGESYQIRFKESQDAARRGEYGQRARATRGRILGLMHEQKRQLWQDLIENCPERLYPPPGGEGRLDFNAKDPEEAAEVAAAQALAMKYPISRAELEAQLAQEFTRDREEWEMLLAREYKAELEYRKQYGIPRPVPQPEPINELLEEPGAPWDDDGGSYW